MDKHSWNNVLSICNADHKLSQSIKLIITIVISNATNLFVTCAALQSTL